MSAPIGDGGDGRDGGFALRLHGGKNSTATAETLHAALVAAGLELRLSETGRLKVTGEQSAVDRWLPEITHQKTELTRLIAARSAGRGALAPADLALANALLDHYGETDPVTRAEYLDRVASSRRLLGQCHAAAVAAGIATWEVAA